MEDDPVLESMADLLCSRAIASFREGSDTFTFGEKVPLSDGFVDKLYRDSGYDHNPEVVRVEGPGGKQLLLERVDLSGRLWAKGIKVSWQDKRGGPNVHGILQQGGPNDGYFGPRIR